MMRSFADSDAGQEAGCDVGDVFGGEAVLFFDRRRGRRGSEVVDSVREPAIADVLVPAERRGGFDRNARFDRGRQHRLAIRRVLLRRRDATTASRRRALSCPWPRAALPAATRELHFRAGRDQDQVGRAGRFVEDVGAARDGGVAIAQDTAASGARARSPTGPVSGWTANFHASSVSSASAGRRSMTLGVARSIASCSIGWCVGPSSPKNTESWVKT